ncbi:hypothetical protein GCM10009789_87730 [Kribbella sancticallisti]|uniref:Uncharacterized protein n=1 Tax=Kribbella sancticallisti TaxID=460087 RepID=A0ABP4QSE5_9ACTN
MTRYRLAVAPPPVAINRRITLRATDHPSTDRNLTIATFHRHYKPVYRVAVIDGFGRYPSDAPTPREFAEPEEARAAANRLLARLAPTSTQRPNGAAS